MAISVFAPIRRSWTAVFSAALLAVVFAPNAKSSDFDKETTVTFSGPVEIPGRVLDAGTYVFKLANLAGSDVVQVFNEDQTDLKASFQSIPEYRLNPPDEALIQLEEPRANGAPQAVRGWYYPGDTRGYEFIYPDTRREH